MANGVAVDQECEFTTGSSADPKPVHVILMLSSGFGGFERNAAILAGRKRALKDWGRHTADISVLSRTRHSVGFWLLR
jgi:hypothetical protein